MQKQIDAKLIESVPDMATTIGLDFVTKEVLVTIERPSRYQQEKPRESVAVGRLLAVTTDNTVSGDTDNTIRLHFNGGAKIAFYKGDTVTVQLVGNR